MPKGIKKIYSCPVCAQRMRASGLGKLFPHYYQEKKCSGSDVLIDLERLKLYQDTQARIRRARQVVDTRYPHVRQEHSGFEDHGVGESELNDLEWDGPHLAEDSLSFGHERDAFQSRQHSYES